MAKRQDLTGQVFGKLKVVKLSDKKRNKCFLWECICECGNTDYSNTQPLTSGHKKTCGCRLANLVGIRTGMLEVISEAGTRRYDKDHCERVWLCKCDCGGETTLATAVITKNIIRSCGCLNQRKGNEHPSWKGFGEISAILWARIIKCGSSRDLQFTITPEYIWNLYLSQDRKCALSDLEIIIDTSVGGECTASLDRIDSNGGYIEGNVQWVHKDVNRMKSDIDEKRFIQMCKAISFKFKEKS